MRKPLHHHLSDYFFPHPRNNHRPNIFSALSVFLIVVAIIVFEASYVVQTKIVFQKTDFLASVLPGTLVALANEDRAASGIGSVVEDALLDTAAQAAADDMAAKGYFAHVSPDGKSPWYWLDQVGYRYQYAGENLAVDFTDSSAVEMAWMNSPTHRANIEKPEYTHVGIGVASGIYNGVATTFVVQFFATPAVEQVEPVRVALAPVKVRPSQIAGPAISAQVLGTETKAAPAEVKPVGKPALALSAGPTSVSWFASLLASPLTTLTNVLYALFVIVAFSFIIAVFIRGKDQHPSVLIGGTLLLALISVAMLASTLLEGGVRLPAEGSASVGSALSN